MDDYDLAGFIAEAADKAWVSSPQLAALRRLDAALAHYAAHDQGSDDAARIATPEWRRAAAATLQNFTAPAASS